MSSPLPKGLGPAKAIAKKARSGSLSADVKELEREVSNLAQSPGETPVGAAAGPANGEVGATGDAPPADAVTDEPSFEEEYDVKDPTGDKMRDKVRGLLTAAVSIGAEGAEKGDAAVVAAAIEEAMYKKFEGNGQPYKNKYRMMSFNLKDKKNQKLRDAVLGKRIAPSRLIEMTSEELANDELKQKRVEVHEKMTREAMPYIKPQATTDMFRCGKCGQRKTRYHQMQTRSADEPMTTFVECTNCGNRWKHAG